MARLDLNLNRETQDNIHFKENADKTRAIFLFFVYLCWILAQERDEKPTPAQMRPILPQKNLYSRSI